MGKSSGRQTVTNVTQLPKWYEDAAKSAIGFADNAANNLMQPYSGNTVAGLDPLTQRAIGLTGQNIGSTNAAYNQAGQTAAGVAGYTPGSFLSGNIGAYMNPYIQNVEQAALGNMQQGYTQALNTIGDRAINAGAFGGSRQGVAEGTAASEMARQYGDLSAQLRAQGYTQAGNMMQSDMDRALQGQQLNLQGAQIQGALASDQQQAYLQSLQSALAAGQINQSQAQALLQQQADQYNALRNMPMEQLNMRLAALGGTQVPTSSTQTTPTTGNPFLSTLGGIGSFLGTLGSLGFISDENAKTNIEHLGQDPGTGLPLYAYDYKSDVERARATGEPMPPKRFGPMAQDIAAMAPHMVDDVGGTMVVRGLL